jgi:hypothetical protein
VCKIALAKGKGRGKFSIYCWSVDQTKNTIKLSLVNEN